MNVGILDTAVHLAMAALNLAVGLDAAAWRRRREGIVVVAELV